MKKEKEKTPIFDSVRKQTAPPSRLFKTKKKQKFRKRKHKGKNEGEDSK
jgi:hypothetical protein